MANNDTTTTLNPGSGGDTMDESLVTQSDGVTQAKRPRVVIGGNAGSGDLVQPTASDPGANPYSLPTLLQGVVNDTPTSYSIGDIRALLLTTEGRLRVSTTPSENYLNFFGRDTQEALYGSVCFSGSPF